MDERKAAAIHILSVMRPRPVSMWIWRVLPLRWFLRDGQFNRVGLWLACRADEHGEVLIAREILGE